MKKDGALKKGFFEVLFIALTVVIGMYQRNLQSFNQCYSSAIGIAFLGICIERYKNNTICEVFFDLLKNYIAICLSFSMLQWLRQGFNFEEYNQLLYVLVNYLFVFAFLFCNKKYKECTGTKKRED